ncbi:hypothetical protein EVAR_67866_1 [Eumeta japonica]|uniref:DUF5641 domain-containing protein n=1 Tax=Eumeta variegata TaxID=151549 RepID=A0A4C2A651_EUMVA|nr:hypothetical protein EVAR_67866_1 [Eumeta japonica]
MGDLPIARLQPGKCFESVGIDFDGPFTVKDSRRRNARTYKAHLCLFVCLTTKAVHLEAVTELSSEAFLAALDRLVARLGRLLVALPEDTWDEASPHPRTRWQMLQKLNQCFWRTWQRDYLHTLQQKTKWLKPTPNIKLNDVVIIVEPNLPASQWILAIVEELHPGKDNVVRVDQFLEKITQEGSVIPNRKNLDDPIVKILEKLIEIQQNKEKESMKKIAARGTQTASVTLAAVTAQKVVGEYGKIRIGWVNCRIRTVLRPVRCYKCEHFGHRVV